jgi:hypothetical protein
MALASYTCAQLIDEYASLPRFDIMDGVQYPRMRSPWIASYVSWRCEISNGAYEYTGNEKHKFSFHIWPQRLNQFPRFNCQPLYRAQAKGLYSWPDCESSITYFRNTRKNLIKSTRRLLFRKPYYLKPNQRQSYYKRNVKRMRNKSGL